MTRLEEIFERVAAIQGIIADVAETSELTPRNASYTPRFVNTLGEATYLPKGFDGTWITRQIIMLMLVGNAAGQEGLEESAALAMLNPVHRTFFNRRQLELEGNDAIVEEAYIVRDSGVSTFEFPPASGNSYIGVSFTLQVRYYVTSREVF